MKKPRPAKTRTELVGMIHHIRYVFTQANAVLIWRFSQKDLPVVLQIAGYRNEAIANASLESSLINLRALNEFFSIPDSTKKNEKQPHNDDLRASDYPGYYGKGSFLTKTTKEEIDKRMAHLSTRRMDDDPGYPVKALLEPAIDRMIHFLEYLRGEFLTFSDPEFSKVIRLIETLKEYTPHGSISVKAGF